VKNDEEDYWYYWDQYMEEINNVFFLFFYFKQEQEECSEVKDDDDDYYNLELLTRSNCDRNPGNLVFSPHFLLEAPVKDFRRVIHKGAQRDVV